MRPSADLSGLEEILGEGSLLAGEADLLAYSYDGALDRGRPDAVVLPRSAEEVRRVVAWCASRKVPFTARGAGTNLSGGCVPLRGGVVVSLARMDRILAIDTGAGTAVVEPGVVNLDLQKELEKVGRFYAPDPASYRVCTLGGNAAENAGGPRCLKYGTTTNHVLGVEAAMPDGSLARFSNEDAGPELASLLVGAEGTLGVITRLRLKTLPVPETIMTVLAGFPSIEASIDCVAAIVAGGILPRVLEAMDRATVESIEAYCRAGYPATEAVLLIELDGEVRRVATETEAVEGLCREHGCVELRRASDPAQRERLWEGRRGAYAAVARIAPNVLVEDGVVPRDKLPEALRRVRKIAEEQKVKVCLLFHAGDGNLHPNIAYDERDADETRRVKQAGSRMLEACVELGGSLSGEHGIGKDKRAAMAWLFTPETLSLLSRVKDALDPDGLANPDKVAPSAEERGSRRLLAPRRSLSAAAVALVEEFRKAAEREEAVGFVGSRTKVPASALEGVRVLDTRGLDKVVELDRGNYTATVEAGAGLKDLVEICRRAGLHAPTPAWPGTLGGLLATKAWPGLRDHLLGLKAVLSSGEVVELGGKVVKNVAGYDIPRLLHGSWGGYAAVLEVTLKLYPYALELPAAPPTVRPFTPNAWHRRLKLAFDPANRLNPWLFGVDITK